ncbi:methylmalonyl-CoA mutase small subunit [Bacteroidia bacterium]|nr:methylmalonyl-CoA mutase small subunit [Bacteroidia bacterium]
MSEKKNLFTEFPPVSTEQWLEKITADLKGADFDKKLVWKTNEGFNVQPFYRAEDIAALQDTKAGVFPYTRGTKKDNDWYVRQNLQVECPKEANKKALEILNKGVTSLGFTFKAEDLNADFIAVLLNGIRADAVELNFRTCVRKSAELAQILVDYFTAKKYDAKSLKGSINLDPINRMLLEGKELTEGFIAEKLAETVKALAPLPCYRAVTVNALTLNNAGAGIVQELGYALAWGVEYLDLLINKGIAPADAAKAIRFTFGVGGNYFFEIAKFRAARYLWAKIVEAYKPQCTCTDCTCQQDSGLDFCPCSAKMKIHAETSYFNFSVYDANVNMLRTQTEAMSAALGGVDSLTVLPYDCAYKQSDDFSERIARNQQLLLKEESHFDKVTDPAAGSYYIETLTAQIAEQAWKIFLETEENGGFLKTVQSGRVQAAVNASAKAHLKNISSRREVLLGTNQFPNFNETAADKIERSSESGDLSCACSDGVPTLKPTREAVEFEALRLATEKSGKRPKVFMLTIGSLAMRLARAQFSSNFFACAGYEIIDNLGFNTVEEGVEAARKVSADIIVLCSSDDEYAELAPAAFKLIGENELFVVAGAPACTDDLKAAGIEYFINVRSNVLETLKGFNEKLLK